jgi:hypothetical protein
MRRRTLPSEGVIPVSTPTKLFVADVTRVCALISAALFLLSQLRLSPLACSAQVKVRVPDPVTWSTTAWIARASAEPSRLFSSGFVKTSVVPTTNVSSTTWLKART